MLLIVLLLINSLYINTDGHLEQPKSARKTHIIGSPHSSRRILKGAEITDTRPYMVYLRQATGHSDKKPPFQEQADVNWLCGGAIVHPRYILTSAACIEDVLYFYIISGTHKWLPAAETNECITNGLMRAVWKCVPKTYRYDGHVFNNIEWMANDIAVVMTDKPFNFQRRIKGCDFIPQPILYNNQSEELENAGTKASVAGWGSLSEYTDPLDVVARTSVNSPELMEADVLVIPKDTCQALWLDRYSHIIEQFMICGKDIEMEYMSQACEDDVLECRQLIYSDEVGGQVRRQGKHSNKTHKVSDRQLLQSLAEAKKARKARRKSLRREGKEIGGFCENDHGGPLVVGYGRTAQVIGIMSAYRTMNNSKQCVGPFLYTSVYKNRHLINCAIYKEMGVQCRTVLRTSSTVLDHNNINWPEERWLKATTHKKKDAKKKHRNHTSPIKSNGSTFKYKL